MTNANIQVKPDPDPGPNPDPPKPQKKISALTKKIEGFDIELIIEDELIKLYYDADHNNLVSTFTNIDDTETFLEDNYIRFLKKNKDKKKDDHEEHKKDLLEKGWKIKPGIPHQLDNVEREK